MNTKNNRQYKGSEVRMEKAMIELLNTMPFEKITVRLICEKAKVNRSTFYVHYLDIYDMIETMENSLRKDLMKEYPIPGKTQALSEKSFIPFLRFIRRHKDFYQVSLKARKDFPIKQGFESIWNEIVKPLSLSKGIKSENEMLYYWTGFQAGFTMIIKQWVDNDCREKEKEIARIIHNIIPSVWL